MLEKLIIAAALATLIYYGTNRGSYDMMAAPTPPVPPSGVRMTQLRGLTAVTPAVLATTNYQIAAIGAPSLAAYMTARQIADQMAGVLAVDVEFRSKYGLSS